MSFQRFSLPKKTRKRILLPNLLFPEYNITFYWQLATRCSCGRMFFQLTWRAAGWGSAVISNGAQPRARNPRAVVAESCNYLNNVRAWPKPEKPSSKSSQWKRSSPVFCCPWQGDTNNGAHICPVSYVPAWVLSEGGFCVCICGCICIGGRVSVSVSESLQLFAIRAAIDAGQVLASWKLKCRGSGKGRSYGMVWGAFGSGKGSSNIGTPPAQRVEKRATREFRWRGTGKTISVIRLPLGRLSQPSLQFQFQFQFSLHLQLRGQLHWQKMHSNSKRVWQKRK